MTKKKVDFLLQQMDYRYHEENWFAPLCKALEGITAVHAAWRPEGTNINTIWQIVNHLAFWTEATVRRLDDNWTYTMDDNDATFGQAGNPEDEGGWQETLRHLHETYGVFRQRIDQMPEEEMDHEIRPNCPLIQALMTVLMHDAYHIGQIYTMKKLQGLK